MAVNEAVTEAVKKARQGGGPSLVECKTYRWRGHFEGDPTVYRSDEELEQWKKKDPIPRFVKILKDQEIIDEQEYENLRSEVKEKINEALQFAQDSPEPDLSEVITDVYYGGAE
jgi:pyruvate dehydrogenase E1 component alpha subunit